MHLAQQHLRRRGTTVIAKKNRNPCDCRAKGNGPLDRYVTVSKPKENAGRRTPTAENCRPVEQCQQWAPAPPDNALPRADAAATGKPSPGMPLSPVPTSLLLLFSRLVSLRRSGSHAAQRRSMEAAPVDCRYPHRTTTLSPVQREHDGVRRKGSEGRKGLSLPLLETAQKQKKRLCFPRQIDVRDLRGKQKVTLVVNKNLIKKESDNDNEVVVYWLIPTLV